MSVVGITVTTEGKISTRWRSLSDKRIADNPHQMGIIIRVTRVRTPPILPLSGNSLE